MIGMDGGLISSTVVPQVQAVFPDGAIQKSIRVGVQVIKDILCHSRPHQTHITTSGKI